jgi:hypothetical protein
MKPSRNLRLDNIDLATETGCNKTVAKATKWVMVEREKQVTLPTGRRKSGPLSASSAGVTEAPREMQEKTADR